MEIDNKKCEICGSEINSYDFYITEDKNSFFCSQDCCKEFYMESNEENFVHASTCGGYYDCKRLNNISDRCRTFHKINFSPYNISPVDILPNRCFPAEISIIRTNMKLYDFVIESEKQSSKLNEETLKLTKSNVKLAKAMFAVTIFNSILILIQIYLQIFH